MTQANDSVSFLDAALPPPSYEDAAFNFEPLYSKLFAILVANNLPFIFEPAEANAEVEGSITSPETRIFVSLPAFIVSIAILCPYVLVTIWLYLRRSWDVLPRLPKSIASTIAYFAASNAVAQMSLQENKDKSFDRKDWRWGYGNFVGSDGKQHVGVECEEWLLNGESIEMLEPAAASEAERGMLAQQ